MTRSSPGQQQSTVAVTATPEAMAAAPAPGPESLRPEVPGSGSPAPGPDNIPADGAAAGREAAAAVEAMPAPSTTQQLSRSEAFAPESLRGDALLAWRRQVLAEGGSASAFDWLLDLGAGLSWPELQALRLQPGRQVSLRCSRPELERLWRRHRCGHEPLQYLVGLCPWRDLTLQVAPGVLIPRQETELLVDLALACLGADAAQRQALRWADLGTGSGCLALALARALPHSQGLAVDASADALMVAAGNLAALGLSRRVSLLQGNWWQPLQPWWGDLQIVVSNPPYIPSATLASLEPGVREHEPTLALDGGPDGLAAIREILAGACVALAPGGWLILEHHHDQSAAVLQLMAQAGLTGIAPYRDLEGSLRFASARRPPCPLSTDG